VTFRAELLPAWASYAEQAGLALRGQGPERRAVCSIHGGERDSLAINVKSARWRCHSCGAAGLDVLAFHRQRTGLGFMEAARELGAWLDPDAGNARGLARPVARPQPPTAPDPAAERKRALAGRLWAQSLLIDEDTPAGQYLLGRGCLLPPVDGDLRWLPALSLFDQTGPAMVGRMTASTDRDDAVGLHVTWLRETAVGQWARGERRYLGPKAGAVVRLWGDEAVTTSLGVSEGLETGLALAHAHRPAWACMDAGNLAALPILAGIEALLVAVDNDDAGRAAARVCAARWASAGVEVRLAMPATAGTDLVDEVAA
jgi:putative DNA primase/helicase